MTYYQKVLQPNEVVRHVGKLHWIIHKHAIVLLLLTIGAGVVLVGAPADRKYAMQIAVLFLGALTVLSFFRSWFITATTEIVVTDKRIIHKVGWISRQTEEMNVSKVETVDVDQGIGGRVLGYGTVMMKGIGGSWEPLRYVAAPVELRNAIMVG